VTSSHRNDNCASQAWICRLRSLGDCSIAFADQFEYATEKISKNGILKFQGGWTPIYHEQALFCHRFSTYSCLINDGDCLNPHPSDPVPCSSSSFFMVASNTLLPVELMMDPQHLWSWLINDLPDESRPPVHVQDRLRRGWGFGLGSLNWLRLASIREVWWEVQIIIESTLRAVTLSLPSGRMVDDWCGKRGWRLGCCQVMLDVVYRCASIVYYGRCNRNCWAQGTYFDRYTNERLMRRGLVAVYESSVPDLDQRAQKQPADRLIKLLQYTYLA